MAFVSMAEYAKQHGASKQAASKWKARGCLKIIDGKVDVAASDRIMAHAGLGRFADRSTEASTVNRQPSKPAVRELAGLAEELTGAAEEAEDLQPALIAFANRLAEGHNVDKITAETFKENGLALLRLIDARKRAGEVVEMADAEAVIFEMFRLQRDAWLNFPSRVAPLIAAELDVEADQVLEALTVHVHQQLSDLGQPSNPLRQDGAAPADGEEGVQSAPSAQSPRVG